MHVFLNNSIWYLLRVDSFKFQVKVHFGHEHFLGLLAGITPGYDVILCQCQDYCIRRNKVFCEVALN